MKKIIALTMALLMLAVCCVSASAYSIKDGDTTYTVETAKGISFSYEGNTSVTAFPRGSSKLDCLVDGDAAKDVTAHDQDGIVLVCNDYVKPKYEENVRNGVSPAMADQPYDQIPRYSFVLEYDETVSFDAIYLSLFHEINACVATPGDNEVTVEYSKNGRDWTPVGTDGIHYYRACDLPDYIMDAAEHNCEVVERIVPLKKKVSAKYVRLTFNFMTIPEKSFWLYYTNVFEWVGFTEIAVASYKSGTKPEILDKDEANVPDVKIEGAWIYETEDTVYYYNFADDGAYGYVYIEMLPDEYKANGIIGEQEYWEGGEFNVTGESVTLRTDDGDTRRLTVALNEDGTLTIDSGIDSFDFVVFTNTIPEPSEPESSEAESSEAPAESTSASTDTSAEASKEESKSESAASQVPLAPTDDEESAPWVLIIVVVLACALCGGTVAFIVVKKKK